MSLLSTKVCLVTKQSLFSCLTLHVDCRALPGTHQTAPFVANSAFRGTGAHAPSHISGIARPSAPKVSYHYKLPRVDTIAFVLYSSPLCGCCWKGAKGVSFDTSNRGAHKLLYMDLLYMDGDSRQLAKLVNVYRNFYFTSRLSMISCLDKSMFLFTFFMKWHPNIPILNADHVKFDPCHPTMTYQHSDVSSQCK